MQGRMACICEGASWKKHFERFISRPSDNDWMAGRGWHTADNGARLRFDVRKRFGCTTLLISIPATAERRLRAVDRLCFIGPGRVFLLKGDECNRHGLEGLPFLALSVVFYLGLEENKKVANNAFSPGDFRHCRKFLIRQAP